MSNVNRVTLVGNLGDKPELRYTPAGRAVSNFRVATNEYWKDKDGNNQKRTEWHRIVVWGKLSEHCSKYLDKGRQVYLEGSLQTRKWTDRDGVDRYTTEIRAERVQFLGRYEQQPATSTTTSTTTSQNEGAVEETPF